MKQNSYQTVNTDVIKHSVLNKIYLYPQTYPLEEVFVKNQQYGSVKKISSNRGSEVREYFGFQFGTEHVNFIKNDIQKPARLKSIILHLKKTKNWKPKNWGIDYVSDFKISFYHYDKKRNIPINLLVDDTIIVSPGNKTQKFEVDLQKYKIEIPPEGFCIGVEIYNSKYKNAKSTFSVIAPFIKFIEKNDFERVTSWVRYNTVDKVDGFKQANILFDNKKKFYKALYLDLKIQYEK